MKKLIVYFYDEGVKFRYFCNEVKKVEVLEVPACNTEQMNEAIKICKDEKLDYALSNGLAVVSKLNVEEPKKRKLFGGN